MQLSIRLAVCCFLVGLACPAMVFGDTATNPTSRNEYIVRFRQGSEPTARARHRAKLGVRFARALPLIDAQVVTASSGFDHAYAKQLLAEGNIDFIEPNYIVHTQTTPNDARFADQWGLHNTGQNGGTSDVDINAPEAWDRSVGSDDVVVGIVDTGVNFNHPDLSPNMWRNPGEIASNGVDDDNNGVVDDIFGYNAIAQSGSPMDDHGHGSHVAGIIAARGNNSIGVSGVLQRAKIMALKFLGPAGDGTTEDAVRAIEYAIRMKQRGVNLRVLNNSWGGSGISRALEDAVNAANEAGLLFVAAAGNSAEDNDRTTNYPATISSPNVVSVAAIDRNGNLATFSNYGIQSVHLAAPGVEIYSTVLSSNYQTMSGTSMAAPFVSGVAAHLAALEPTLSPADIRARLQRTAKYLPTLSGLIATPGTVDAAATLTNTPTPPPPQNSPRYTKSTRPFDWNNDIGERVLQVDDGFSVKSLPFEFQFYQQPISRISISANGRVTPLRSGDAEPTSADYANRPLPGISVFHDDLVPANDSRGGVWLSANAEKATITWISAPYSHRHLNNPASLLAFQVAIFPSGEMRFVYLDTDAGDQNYSNAASATVGILPLPGTTGDRLTVAHNEVSTQVSSQSSFVLDATASAGRNDFDGDGVSDLVIYRSGWWHILVSGDNFSTSRAIRFGGARGDEPMLGDFDGDSRADLVIWRPRRGTFYYRTSSSEWSDQGQIRWAALKGEAPYIGDYDGDRTSDIAFFQPSNGAFRVRLSSRVAAVARGSKVAVPINNVKLAKRRAVPLIADFAGFGVDSLVAVDPRSRIWTAKSAYNQTVMHSLWGVEGDSSLACDFDGSGIADKVVVRHSPGDAQLTWFVMGDISYGTALYFGEPGGQIGCGSDFDGDGKSDIYVYTAATGIWSIRLSATGNTRTIQWGAPGDRPLL